MGTRCSLMHFWSTGTVATNTLTLLHRCYFSFPFDLTPLVRVGSFKARSLSSCYLLFELVASSLGIQGLLLIDGMHWTWACWLWHFQTAHFLQWQRAKAMGLTAIFSKPGNETGHQEQVTASQGTGANQAKHGVGSLGPKEECISFAAIVEEIIQSCSPSWPCQNLPSLLSRFNCAHYST